MISKSQFRQSLTRKRQALTAQQLKDNSYAICQRLSEHFLKPELQLSYAIYWPFGNEVDLRPLLKKHPNGHIPSVFNKKMQFQSWHPELMITMHPLGMMQPAYITESPPAHLNLCFLPLLGFDAQGHRLGMGGGFYDRYFESNTNTQLIGVAHDCQQVDALPTDDWDVKLHAIATESQLITP